MRFRILGLGDGITVCRIPGFEWFKVHVRPFLMVQRLQKL